MFKKIYHTIAQYFKKSLPLKNTVLRDLQILHPSFKSAQYTDKLLRVSRLGLLTYREIDNWWTIVESYRIIDWNSTNRKIKFGQQRQQKRQNTIIDAPITSK